MNLDRTRLTLLCLHAYFRDAIQMLQDAIKIDIEQLQELENSLRSKQRAIADDEEQLQLHGKQILDLRAEMGCKALGKLTQAEAKEKHELSNKLFRLQVKCQGL